MECPTCGAATTVRRTFTNTGMIRRRRNCPNNHAFFTIERIDVGDQVMTPRQLIAQAMSLLLQAQTALE